MPDKPQPEPVFFALPAEFRAWLAAHHASAQELWVGYYKKATGRPSVSWEQTVEEALCFGWIDGIRKSRDAESYVVRFTPRKRNSVWSQRNIELVEKLKAEERMTPAGLEAYAHKGVHPDSGYRAANDSAQFSAAMLEHFQASVEAWGVYQAQPPGYRRQTCRWVMSARREETRWRRLSRLMDACAAGERLN